MKYLLFISFFLLVWDKYNRIAEMNALKAEAANHYEEGAYKEGIKLYEKLINQYEEKDERLKLNLANSYFQLNQYTKATNHYKALVNSTDSTVKSIAYLQLGVIQSRNKKKELGLMYFREALKASSGNEAARYNYELLKKEQVQNKNPEDASTDKKKENSNGANQTGASVGSVAGHMAYSGYFGYFIGLSIMKPSRRWQILTIGYLSSALLHALWNTSALVSFWLLAIVGGISYAFLVAAILKAHSFSNRI